MWILDDILSSNDDNDEVTTGVEARPATATEEEDIVQSGVDGQFIYLSTRFILTFSYF